MDAQSIVIIIFAISFTAVTIGNIIKGQASPAAEQDIFWAWIGQYGDES